MDRLPLPFVPEFLFNVSVSDTASKGRRSNSAIDLQAAQRAKARAQYAAMARQKIASGTCSLRKYLKKSCLHVAGENGHELLVVVFCIARVLRLFAFKCFVRCYSKPWGFLIRISYIEHTAETYRIDRKLKNNCSFSKHTFFKVPVF